MMATQTQIAIVIPTYNEAENVKNLIPLIHKHMLHAGYGNRYHCVIVDDNSPDQTGLIAEELAQTYPVRVIHRSGKRGYGEACKEGFRYAIQKADVIITMDSDLSHDPKELPLLIKQLEQGNDIIIGSRYREGGKIENWSLLRRFMSKSANLFTKKLLHLPVSDCTSGYRSYKKEVLKNKEVQQITANGYSFLEELLFTSYQKGYKIAEIPICFVERQYGSSKLSKKEIMKFLFTVIRLKIRLLLQ